MALELKTYPDFKAADNVFRPSVRLAVGEARRGAVRRRAVGRKPQPLVAAKLITTYWGPPRPPRPRTSVKYDSILRRSFAIMSRWKYALVQEAAGQTVRQSGIYWAENLASLRAVHGARLQCRQHFPGPPRDLPQLSLARCAAVRKGDISLPFFQ